MRELKKKILLRFSTLVVLTASFTVILGAIVAGQNLQRVLTLWGESLQMTVYLSHNASADAASQIETTLKKDDRIEKVQFVSQEKALSQFRDQMASYAPDLLNDNDLIKVIPPSYQFSVSTKIDSSEQLGVMNEIANSLQHLAGVDQVSYGQDWVKSYTQITSTITKSGIVFALVIIGSALFVISNCIRSSIYQRKEEIEVLELIGATARYIRRPFLMEGVFLCTGAANLGLLSAFGLFTVIQENMKAQLSFLQLANHLQFLSFGSILTILVAAAAVGWGAAMVCLHSLNDGWAATQKAKVQ
jgi:cell division transport system permease protein